MSLASEESFHAMEQSGRRALGIGRIEGAMGLRAAIVRADTAGP
jgi:hypothetical protein